MTGYGAGRATSAGTPRQIVIELRSVNHRFLECRLRFGPDLQPYAAVAEETARARLGRGSVDVTGRIEGGADAPITLDVARARTAYRQLTELRDELCPGEPVRLELLGAVPDLFMPTAAGERDPALEAAVRAACEAACNALDSMRRREGAALRADLTERLTAIGDRLEEIVDRLPELRALQATRLTTRVNKLLEIGGQSARSVDPGRLEHELAILADRSDIAEEVTRLESHLAQAGALVATDGEPVGRKLEFLVQEMNREANTIGAKSGDATTSQRVVDIKAELERMREQLQNVV